MKFNALAFLAVATAPATAFQPATPLSAVATSGSSLNMVLEKPKKLSKLEILKTQSEHLENPLREVRILSRIDWHIFFRWVWLFWFRRKWICTYIKSTTKCRWKVKFWKLGQNPTLSAAI